LDQQDRTRANARSIPAKSDHSPWWEEYLYEPGVVKAGRHRDPDGDKNPSLEDAYVDEVGLGRDGQDPELY
jgi:hypothetical protein